MTPRPSATVVLVRDSDQGPELLLVLRRSGDAFGDSYTFPGGVLDATDADASCRCSGLDADAADAVLGTESGGLDYYVAVVRELFEETGILLGASKPVNAKLRSELLRGKLSWQDLLKRERISVPCDALHYFAHWITPAELPKRWSTRFFLATMPDGQDVHPDGAEITDYCWTSVDDALASAGSGERKIPFPTRRTIESMAGRNTVAALIEWARQRQADGIAAIQPEIRSEDGKRRIFLPEIGD